MTPPSPPASTPRDIVVGRLAETAAPLITALGKAGYRVIAQPGLRIIPITDPTTAIDQLGQIGRDDLVVFVSVPAVTHTFSLLPEDSMLRRAQCAAVGPATAAALASHRISAITASQGTGGEALLARLTEDPGREALARCKAWIVGAPDGRTTLLEQLGHWCSQARAIHVYQRTAAPATRAFVHWLDCLHQSTTAPPCLIATSDAILRQLTALIDQRLDQQQSPLADRSHSLNRRRWPVLLNSERIAETARALEYSRPLIAPSAADDALVETLRQSLGTR